MKFAPHVVETGTDALRCLHLRELCWNTVATRSGLINSRGMEAHIYIKELLAALWRIEELIAKLASQIGIPGAILLLIDNTAAMYALRRWYSSNYNAQEIIKRIHKLVGELGINLVVERVSSEHNPSDEPSRGFYPQQNKKDSVLKKLNKDSSTLQWQPSQKSRPSFYDDDAPDVSDLTVCIGEQVVDGIVTGKPENPRGKVPCGTYW